MYLVNAFMAIDNGKSDYDYGRCLCGTISIEEIKEHEL